MAQSRCKIGSSKKSTASRRNPEDAFLKQVLAYAKVCGWRTAHFRPGMMANGRWVTPGLGDFKGFPDLVLVRHRVVYAELKSNTGRQSKEQKEWQKAIACAGEEFYLWRPKDWDFITKALR